MVVAQPGAREQLAKTGEEKVYRVSGERLESLVVG